MNLFQFSIATRSLNQPLKRSLLTIADWEVPGVELDSRWELRPDEFTATGQRQFRHLLKELGLTLSAIHFPAKRSFANSEHLDARIEHLKKVMQFAREMQTEIVTTKIGKIPEESESKDYQLLHEVVNDLAKYGNTIGINLGVIPGGESIEALSQFCSSIDQGFLGISLDPAAIVWSQQNPCDAVRSLYQRLLFVQARDAILNGDENREEVPLGEGDVDWDELLALLEHAGYNRWVSLVRTQGEHRTNDLTRGLRILQEMIQS